MFALPKQGIELRVVLLFWRFVLWRFVLWRFILWRFILWRFLRGCRCFQHGIQCANVWHG
jgi:hypothetical protein